MSLLKPDVDYDPSKRLDMYIPTKNNSAINPETTSPPVVISKEDFHKNLQIFVNNFEDLEVQRFFKLSKITFKTSINVLDSVSLLEKFATLYVGTLKKTFPKKDWEAVEKSFFTIKDFVADSLKHDNVENKFLIPMLLGILEGILNYENY